MGGYDSDSKECDGCREPDAKYIRNKSWHVCAKCRAIYDDARRAAKADLLIMMRDPLVHRWRVTGTLLGSIGDETSGYFTIPPPGIIAEHACSACAVRKALRSIDPWGFESYETDAQAHGLDLQHDPHDIHDMIMWHQLGVTGHVEDLGVVSEATWNERAGIAPLPGMPRLIARRAGAGTSRSNADGRAQTKSRPR